MIISGAETEAKCLKTVISFKEAYSMKREKDIIEDLESVIDMVAGEGTYVRATEAMTGDEVEFELRAAFIKEGYTPEEAAVKTRELVTMAEKLLGGHSVN